MFDKLKLFIKDYLNIDFGGKLLGVMYILAPMFMLITFGLTQMLVNYLLIDTPTEHQGCIYSFVIIVPIIGIISLAISIWLFEILMMLLFDFIDLLKRIKEKYERKHKREIS